MGCDIHMVLERKSNGTWIGLHNYNTPELIALDTSVFDDSPPTQYRWIAYKIMGRNYTLFGELAGVRTAGTLGNEPRGIPQDASQLTNALVDEWDSDGHSHSHLSLSEFIAAYAAATGESHKFVEHRLSPTVETTDWFHNLVTMITGHNIYDKNYDDYRICFWFDN